MSIYRCCIMPPPPHLAVGLVAVLLHLLAVSAASSAEAAPDLVLTNGYLSVSFSASDFSITSFLSHLHSPPYEFLSSPCTSWWSATIVTNASHSVLTSASPAAIHSATSSPSTLLLYYRGLSLPSSLGSIDLQLRATLAPSSPYLLLHYELRAISTTQPIAIWDWTWSIDHLRPSSLPSTSHDDALLISDSYGSLYRRPLTHSIPRLDQQYPSGSAAYQFWAYYHELNTTAYPPTHPGLYFATHDPDASLKTFSFLPSADSVGLSVRVAPPNSAAPQPQAGVAFPFVLGVFSGDWWDAAQLYRAFALTAPWTAQSIRERSDWPRWLQDVQVWVNSGWQGHDVFNSTQGDPDVVLQRVTAIQQRFGLPRGALALHWYVFQRSNSFDQYYPVYFPAKDNFTETVAALQSQGVQVFPYVNGRVFDTGTDRWTVDDAQRFAAKYHAPQLDGDLSVYYEEYGNDVRFAAMCPATRYWQQTYADALDTLVHTHGVHGTYVDQVGAAAAQACFDPSHGHPLGDGTAWVTGYRDFFALIRQHIGPGPALVTESNAEPYMQMLNGYLTLTAMQKTKVGASGLLTPVFPAVYGGYMMGFGAIFTVADLVDNPDGGFTTTLAAQFVYGAQLGWMSLGGTQDPAPMGLYDLLMSSAHDAEVQWLQRLALTRARVVEWLTHGRLMRPPPLRVTSQPSPPPTPATSSISPPSVPDRFGKPALSAAADPPPQYLASTWYLPSNATVGASLVVLVAVPGSNVTVGLSLVLNVTDVGFAAGEATGQFTVTQLMWDGGKQTLGTFGGGAVQWKATLKGRQAVALLIQPAAPTTILTE